MKQLAELVALTEDALDEIAKGFTALKSAQKAANDEWKSAFPELGKVYCALEIRLNQGQRTTDDKGQPVQPRYSPSMSLADMIEKSTGKKPENHGLQCKNAFATFVGVNGVGLVPEEVYDRLPSNVVELAGRVAKAAGFALNSVAIIATAKELNAYGKKTVSNLKALLETLVPAEKLEAADAEKLLEKLEEEGNLKIVLVMAVLKHPAYIAGVLARHYESIELQETAGLVAKAAITLLDKAETKWPDFLAVWAKQCKPAEIEIKKA